MLSRKKLAVVIITAAALLASSSPAFAAVINGSGATFDSPLIDACRVQFAKETGHDVNYTGGGSGKGRTDFSNKIVEFAGSDTAYSPAALEPRGLVYAPIYAAPISIFYNLPGLSDTITLSPDTLAKIFSGEIQKWNDNAIAADNKRVTREPVFQTKQVKQTITDKKTKKKTTKTTTVSVLDAQGKPVISGYKENVFEAKLPDTQIQVWYRSDSSGTSENFANYLKGSVSNSTIWPKSASGTFANTTPKPLSGFFNFQGASGSAAVAAGVVKNVGAIGYGELSFATDNKLPSASIINPAGEAIAPSSAGTSAFLGAATLNSNGTLTYDYKTKTSGAYTLGTTSYGMASTSYGTKLIATTIQQWYTYILEKCPTSFPEKGFALIQGKLAELARTQIAKIGSETN
jgi:phosphate transport system substrate-binding protein